MADIKQAAQWMDEGKRVRRKRSNFYTEPIGINDNGFMSWLRPSGKLGDSIYLTPVDLLADDWEIVP